MIIGDVVPSIESASLSKAQGVDGKKRVLILAAANISTCPRAMKMVEILKNHYDVSVMGIDGENGVKMPAVPGVKSFSYPAYKRRNKLEELKLWWNVACKNWDALSFIPNRLEIIEHLKCHRYDVVICHDLLLLPVLFAGLESRQELEARPAQLVDSAQGTKVIFDAREFYPWQNTSSWRWKVLFKAFNEYLCATYAPRADKIFSVSPRFCELYWEHFGLKCEPLLSLPPLYDQSPTPVDSQKIKILYHGALNQNRDIHKVIELCTLLDERFCIDFIFTGGEERFRRKILARLEELQQTTAVRVLPAVKLEEIVPFGNAYDIGLIYIPEHNHNLCATLPNKFFEYIQSRLALLLPPIPSLVPFVERYGNGIVAKDFRIHSLALALKNLSADELQRLKHASHLASQELHLGKNTQIVHQALHEVLGDGVRSTPITKRSGDIE